MLTSCSSTTPLPSGTPIPSVENGGTLEPSATQAQAIGHIVRTIPLAQTLLGVQSLAAGDGSIWVAESGFPHGRVLRIDTGTGREVANIAVGWAPAGLLMVGHGVWVADTIGDGSRADADQNQVEMIDTRINAAVARYPVSVPAGLAELKGAIWVVSPDGASQSTIRRVAPAGSPLDGRYVLPEAGARQLAVAAGKLWTTTWNSVGGTDLWGIDPSRKQLPVPIGLHGQVTAIVSDGTDLYVVGSPGTRTLSRINPGSGTTVATSQSIDAMQAIEVAHGNVWVATGTGELRRLSSADLAEDGAPLELGGTPSTLVAGEMIWIMTDAGLMELQPMTP